MAASTSVPTSGTTISRARYRSVSVPMVRLALIVLTYLEGLRRLILIWPQRSTTWVRTGENRLCAARAAAPDLARSCEEVMLKLLLAFAALWLPPAALAGVPLGPDAARCSTGTSGNALLVAVSGLKSQAGTLRVQLYGANPADFLAKGKKLRRLDVPVTGTAMDVCVALPGTGRYAVAVRHDADANRKSGWSDGGGFSRNPSISLTKLQPRHSQVAFNVGPGIHRVPVVMQYRRGLSIGPIKRAGG